MFVLSILRPKYERAASKGGLKFAQQLLTCTHHSLRNSSSVNASEALREPDGILADLGPRVTLGKEIEDWRDLEGQAKLLVHPAKRLGHIHAAEVPYG